MKPIEFNDFSGGITDKDVPGKTNRAQTCDNLLIDYDKKLLQRDGFDIVSSTAYQLAAAERVSRLANFDNDSEVLAFQNKKAFAIAAGAWTEVVGPGGGSSTTKAFNTNTAASLLEESQWQHHLFAASNSGDPVIKMYRDSGAVMRLRTAGLPEFTSSLTPTDGGLALSITLANDLRTKMIAHYGANAVLGVGTPSNGVNDHHFADTALAAQATAATASVAATDLPTLITLLNVLRTQYGKHVADAQREDVRATPTTAAVAPFRAYHMAMPAGSGYYTPHLASTTNQPLYIFRHYMNFTAADQAFTIPSGSLIADVIPYLNDLRDKWNWHTYAPMTHYNAAYWNGNNFFTYLGSHATAVARVEPYTWAQITPNMGPFLQFLIDLKTEYDAHRLNDMHMEHDTVWVVPSGVSGSPTNFQDAVTLMGWLSHCITYHALEPDTNFCGNGQTGFDANVTGTTTSGAATLTLSTGGAAADYYKFLRVVPIVAEVSVPDNLWALYKCQDQTKLYNVTSSNTATPSVLTCANNFTASEAAKAMVLTARHYHLGTASAQLFDHRALAQTFDGLDFLLQSASGLQGFADYAKSLALYLKNHTIDRTTAIPASAASQVTINSQKYSARQNGLGTAQNAGATIIVHAGQDNTNYPTVGGLGGIYLSLNSALLSANTPVTQLEETRFVTAPEAASFLYKAVFKYDYTVGTVSFTDRSAPSVAVTAIGFFNEDSGGRTETGKFAASLANIQVFANAANENFAHTDTTNFRKEIYRTLGNGTRFYKVNVNDTGGDITNAATTLSDYSSDTYLVDQLELYTNGGTPENNRPPVASGIHVFGNVMFYVVGNKVYQSIPNDLDSVPSDFFEEFEENVVAVSSTRSVAVAFTPTKVSRLTGGIDDLGRGTLGHDVIFDRTGAISAQSVVKADNGIFFAGKDGFYFTDGYQCMRVTDLEKTFRTYTNTAAKRNSIQGTYDNISKRVYWTVTTAGGSSPDRIWVLDLQFGIKPDATPVVTLSKTSGFNPTALTYFNGQIYYGDADGYTFVQTRGLNLDLVKDTSVAATLWAKETIQWDFKSCNYDYGTSSLRKYFTRAGAQFDMQSTNVSCQIVSDADKGRVTSNLPVIRSRKLTDWGDSKLDWISTVYPAKAGNLVDEWRWFKADGSLRSNYRAVELKTAYCPIVKSDDMGTVTIANVAGNVYTVTLTSLVDTRKWPLYSVGYFVRINSVDYPVTVRTSDSVIRIDSTGLTSPSAGVPASWELWGYPKNEKVRLIGYGVNVDLVDEQQSHSDGPVVTGGQNV